MGRKLRPTSYEVVDKACITSVTKRFPADACYIPMPGTIGTRQVGEDVFRAGTATNGSLRGLLLGSHPEPCRSLKLYGAVLPSTAAFQAQIYRSLPETERAGAIVDRISKAIALGLLKVGERLPPETTLAEMFGVAPSTLREALADLRDQGIVTTRRGRSGGTFIVKHPFTPAEAINKWFRETSIAEIRDAGDEHAAIAAAAVRLACERAEAHEISRLLDLARTLALADKPELRARADSRFHIELAVLAQSPRLMNAEIRLQAEIVQPLWAPAPLTPNAERVAAEHAALAHAITNQAHEEAQRLMLEHIRHDVHHLVDAKLSLGYPTSQQERP